MEAREAYALWLANCAEDTRAELLALEGNDKEIEDRFYTELEFGTAGMRGVLGAGTNRMNAYNVRRTTQGLADYLLSEGIAARGVAIGYDSRRYSDVFALEAALTLCANGIPAYLFDELRPVALLSFAVRTLGCAAGIVITASHNPKEYNGYKVYGADGGQFPPEPAAEVLAYTHRHSYWDALTISRAEAEQRGLLHSIGAEIDDQYQAMVQALCVDPALCREKGGALSIVYTPLNGSGNKPVRRVLRDVGFTRVSVVPEQELPDPEFTTVGVPNPENASAFTLAIAQAERENADLIFGTDPDCDRLGVACRDREGKTLILTGNQIGCLLLDYILTARKPTPGEQAVVVKSLVSTELANAICAAHGAALTDVLTGFKYIAEKIQEIETAADARVFVFGFEESYGYLSGTSVRDKDAVNASMLLAECALHHKQAGRTLYEGLLALYERFGWYLEEVQSVTLQGVDGLRKMKALMAALRENPFAQIAGQTVVRARDLLHGEPASEGKDALPPADVLLYHLENTDWVCVRPSGTEPKVKLYYNVAKRATEAEAREALKHMRASVMERMQAWV